MLVARRPWSVFVALALVAWLVPTSAALAAPVALTGTVSGQLPGQSPQAVVGATVTAADAATHETAGSTTTNASGAFSLSLEPGTYDVTVSPGAGSPFGPSTVPGVSVPTANLTIALVPAASSTVRLTGRLMTADGVGIPGASVNLDDDDPDTQAQRSTTTLADGSYAFSVVPGRYRLTGGREPDSGAEPTPGAPAVFWFDAGYTDVASDRVVDVRLPRPADITVSVLDDGGAPMAGALVSLRLVGVDAPGSTVPVTAAAGGPGTISTDAGGTAVFHAFACGCTVEGTVRPATSTGYAETAFTVTVDGDVQTTVQPARASIASLTGRITTAGGAPVPGIVIELVGANGSTSERQPTGGTRADGTFAIVAPTGTYRLVAERTYDPVADPIAGAPDEFSLRSEPFELTEDRTLDVALPELVDVTTTVLDDADAPLWRALVSIPFTGAPATTGGDLGVGVVATAFTSGMSPTFTASTGTNGVATVRMFDGGCTITASVRPTFDSGYETTSFDVTVDGDTSITVHPVRGDFVHLSGRVVTADGTPVPQLGLRLETPGSSSQGAGPGAPTAADGTYSITAPPGTYRLSGLYQFDTHVEPLKPRTPGVPDTLWLSAESVDLSADRRLDLTLPALRTVTVRVLDATDAPIVGTSVSLPPARASVDVAGTPVTLEAAEADGRMSHSTDAAGEARFPAFEGGVFPRNATVHPPGLPYGSPVPSFAVPDVSGDTTVVVHVTPIDSTAPAVDSASLSPTAVPTGVATTLTVHASDNVGVVAGEWFLGADPGSGRAAPLSSTGDGTWTASVVAPSEPGSLTVTARVVDAAGTWSAPTTVDLTVLPEDADGVDGAIEASAPNGGDGNSDGIKDYEQGWVTSLPAAGAEPTGDDVPFVTIAAAGGTTLTAVSTSPAPPGAPAGLSLPSGLVDFTVTGLTPGASQTISIYAGPTTGINGYAKYDNGTWTLMPPDLVTIHDDHLEVLLTDGGIGDADGTANGVIVDPGALATITDRIDGFSAPVDMNGILNTVRAGSTVPLKFRLYRGGNEVTDLTAISAFTLTKISCTRDQQEDAIEWTTAGATSLRYDTTSGQFIQNWKTPRTPNTCYRATITTTGLHTTGATQIIATFKLT